MSGRAAVMTGAVALGVSVAAVVGAATGSLDTPAIASRTAVRGAGVAVGPFDDAATARYRVTLVIDWSRATHPATLPGGAHISPPVLSVHADPGDLFAVGGIATNGIESMAERGGTSSLTSEQRRDPSVLSVTTRSGFNVPGNVSFVVDLDRGHPHVSLVTMVAPSPDWFFGVSDVLLHSGGSWAAAGVLPLGAYDAGTDSGSRFGSGDADSRPRAPISGPRDSGFVAAAAEAPFGRVVIERLS